MLSLGMFHSNYWKLFKSVFLKKNNIKLACGGDLYKFKMSSVLYRDVYFDICKSFKSLVFGVCSGGSV